MVKKVVRIPIQDWKNPKLEEKTIHEGIGSKLVCLDCKILVVTVFLFEN